MKLTLAWPPPVLPGVCLVTGAPTRQGVVVRPRGTREELVVPITAAARLRWQALARIRLAALTVLAGCAALAALAPWLAGGALVCAAVAVAATAQLRTVAPRLRLAGGTLQVRGAHPRFAAALSRPAGGCGRTCETCLSGCLPQVQLQD